MPLILIDAAHGNVNAGGREMRMFIKDLSDHRYNVLKQLTPFTATDLNTDTVKLLVITAPETAYSTEELDAIAEYAATGGSLWICNLADYTGKLAWANTVADRLNALVERIETRVGAPINMRMNDDEVIDANTNNGYVFGVEPGSFPGASATSIGVNVESISTWSLGSIRGRLVTQPITAGTPSKFSLRLLCPCPTSTACVLNFFSRSSTIPGWTSATIADVTGLPSLTKVSWSPDSSPILI